MMAQEIADTPWNVGDIVEYDDYGAKFRGRLRMHTSGNFWRGVVTEIDSAGAIDGLYVGEDVSFIEGHSKKIADAKVTVGEEMKTPSRPLVGPAPKVETPVYVAPFRYGGGTVFQANGSFAFDIDLRDDDEDTDTRDELGEFIAAALNARVFSEE